MLNNGGEVSSKLRRGIDALRLRVSLYTSSQLSFEPGYDWLIAGLALGFVWVLFGFMVGWLWLYGWVANRVQGTAVAVY